MCENYTAQSKLLSTIRLLVPVLFFMMLFPVTSIADGPDTMAGRWVVESFSIDGKDIPAEKSLTLQTKVGTLWKLHADGTGDISSFKQKWKYDKEKQSFTISQDGALPGFREWISNADVTKDGDKIVVEWTTLFAKKARIVLTPAPK